MLTHLRRWILFNWLYAKGKPRWDSGISPPELMAHLASHSPGRALDLGCGTGTNVITLARHGWQTTGIDFAPGAIQQAKTKLTAAKQQADLRVGDVSKLDALSPGFDLILDIGCFHGIPPAGQRSYVSSIKRLLAPAGTFLLYAHHYTPGSRMGIRDEDLALFGPELLIVDRKDGTDKARGGGSCWLTIRRASAIG